MSVGVGVGTSPSSGAVETLLEAAQTALGRAKFAGRDCVRLAAAAEVAGAA